MRIGYFGGSFDPPHRGHLAVACSASSVFKLDRILFVPSANQPLKAAGLVAPYTDRLAMVSILCAEAPEAMNFELSGLESPKSGGTPHYTVDTLRTLRASLSPADTLFVVVGADSFLDLHRWREADQLLEMAEWIVASRPGFYLSQNPDLESIQHRLPRLHVLDTLADPVSSSEIRARLSTGLPCEDLLPPQVLAYIQEHHLYGT